MNPDSFPLAGALLRRCFARTGCVSLLVLALGQPLLAQAPATGRTMGRIFNPATQEYVRNAEITVEGTNAVAFSGDDGSYVLSNVPAGDVAPARSKPTRKK